MKNRISVTLFALVLLLAGFALGGCNTPQEESQLPWAQPADWEGRVPGMPHN